MDQDKRRQAVWRSQGVILWVSHDDRRNACNYPMREIDDWLELLEKASGIELEAVPIENLGPE